LISARAKKPCLIARASRQVEIADHVEERVGNPDHISLTVEGLFPSIPIGPIGLVGNVGYRALASDLGAKPISIISLITQHDGAAVQVNEKRSSTMTVVHLASGKHQANRPAQGINDGMYLCR
jgi:hypothetical protein